ncbi:MAG: hypothetical protein AB7N80_12935 [Bdellovibrionales bacterium]
MEKLNWIKDLVLAEQQMEDTGMVDMSAGFDAERELELATTEFLADLKTGFIESASTFNQLKGSAVGTIKIYGISKTQSDFMLFRNGYKLIFSMKQPGLITISFNATSPHFVPGQAVVETPAVGPVDTLKARWGAYGELVWTSNELQINLDYLVRYYVSRFVRESTK